MRFPDRLLGSVAAHASHIAKRRITEHMILLGLGFRIRSEQGLTLSEAVDQLGHTRRYGRHACQLFSIQFPDFVPATPLDLPLE